MSGNGAKGKWKRRMGMKSIPGGIKRTHMQETIPEPKKEEPKKTE